MWIPLSQFHCVRGITVPPLLCLGPWIPPAQGGPGPLGGPGRPRELQEPGAVDAELIAASGCAASATLSRNTPGTLGVPCARGLRGQSALGRRHVLAGP